MKTIPYEICRHLTDGFRDCERIGCEEHDGPRVIEEYEVDYEWMLEEDINA